jgi:predicted enzyme related to lactoylglutathione lyase
MTAGAQTIVYPVRDLDAATAVFTALLGAAPDHAAPYYVGWEVGAQHVGLDPNGHRDGATGPLAFWHVEDIRASSAALVAAGAIETEAAHDVGGGRLVATLTDADGNRIGLLQQAS